MRRHVASATATSSIIESRRGTMKAQARVTPIVRDGQVFIPMHYAATNLLTNASFDKYSRQPSYKSGSVQVRATREAVDDPFPQDPGTCAPAGQGQPWTPTTSPRSPTVSTRRTAWRRAVTTPCVRASPTRRRPTRSRNSSSDIARHAQLLEPLCPDAEVRVLATPGKTPGTWNLDLASLDRPCLLAMFTGILVHEAIEVERAVLATWDDGAALQALVVRSSHAPDVTALQALTGVVPHTGPLRSARRRRHGDLRPVGLADLHRVRSDRARPPGPVARHRRCHRQRRRRHPRRFGATIDGVATDRFDLSDATQLKLNDAVGDAIAANLRNGFSGGGT